MQALKGTSSTQRRLMRLAPKLHGSEYFTLDDAKSGYWMVELDSESSSIDNFQHGVGEV